MSGPLDPLSPRAQDMLGNLAAYEQDDPSVVAIMRAGADELDAIQELAELVRDQAWPHRADDSYGLLSIHEAMLNLPVAPAGATIVQRQAAAKAAVQGRKVGSKANWRARLNTAMRGAAWSYEENFPAPGQLTVRIAFVEGSAAAAQVNALVDRITPAHLEIIVSYQQGFIVGVSRTGEEAL